MSYQRKSLSGEEDKTVTIAAGSEAIGTVALGAGTAEIGKLAAGSAAIGKLGPGTAEIGKLAAGTAAIGSVTVGAGTASIGTVGITPATWFAIDNDASGTTSDASKTGESGKKHYICGIAAGFEVDSSGTIEHALCTLSSAGVVMIKFKICGSSEYLTSPGGSAPALLQFAHPLECGTNYTINFTVDPDASGGTTYANMWGFTI